MSDQEIQKSRVGPAPKPQPPDPAGPLVHPGPGRPGPRPAAGPGVLFLADVNHPGYGYGQQRQLFLGPPHPPRHRLYYLPEMAGTAPTLAALLVGPGGHGPGVRDIFPGGRAHHRIYFPAWPWSSFWPGSCGSLGGWRLVRLLSFPLLLLALVIPLPQMVLSRLTLQNAIGLLATGRGHAPALGLSGGLCTAMSSTWGSGNCRWWRPAAAWAICSTPWVGGYLLLFLSAPGLEGGPAAAVHDSLCHCGQCQPPGYHRHLADF